MYITSDGYKNANLQYDKKYESKIAIGSRMITNDNLISFNIQQSIQQGETFSVGNTISSCLNLMFLHNDVETDDKSVVDLKLGLLVNNAYEYIPLGVYNINSINSNDTTTTLLCYDNMVKFDISYTEKNENPTLHTIINRLVELTGVKFGGTLSDYKDYKLQSLKGYSCREVLGFVAGVLGTNAIIDRTGKFNFISISTNPIYAIERFELISKDGSVVMTKNSEVLEVKAQVGFADADNYHDYTKKNKNYKISKIINSFNSKEISLGTTDSNSVALTVKNPFIDKDILQDIYNKLNGLEYLPYSLSWSGDISLDLGDLITITDSKGVMRAHPILSQNITYNGALTTMLGANGDTKLANDYVIKSEEEAELDRTQEDLEDTKEEVNSVKAEINVLQDSIELKAEKSEVETVKTDVQNVKKDISSINIDLNSITQRVSTTEETVTSINGNVTNLESRMDSAEQKITSDAIVSTVSSEFYKKTETDSKYLTSSSSTITQLAESIESKVSSDDVSTLVKQNADSWGLSIDGKLKGTNYTFDGDNFTIGSSTGSTTAYHNNSQSKWLHSDGSYTQVSSAGLMRYVSGEGKMYHSLIATGEVRVAYGRPDLAPEEVEITLPVAFKWKPWKVTLSIKGWGNYGDNGLEESDGVPFVSWVYSGYTSNGYSTGKFSIYGEVLYRTVNNKTANGYLDISYTVIA